MDDLVKLLEERAASYGALRKSSITAIALDRAAAALTAAQAREAADKARIAELEALTFDPNAVHINLLGNSLARPSLAQIIHVYRPEAILDALAEYNWEWANHIAAAIRNLKGTAHE